MEESKNDSAFLPERFGYLARVVEAFTSHRAMIDDNFRTAENLSPEQLQEVTEAYREIIQRCDVHALSAGLVLAFMLLMEEHFSVDFID